MSELTSTNRELQVSKLAENIIGSEIIKLAGEVNEKIKQGEKIYNLTIGDFNPKQFPIPAELKQLIVEEYFADQTNYPAADGMLELRNAVCNLLKERAGLKFKNDEDFDIDPTIFHTDLKFLDCEYFLSEHVDHRSSKK